MAKGRKLKGTHPCYEDVPEKFCPPTPGVIEVGVSVMTSDDQNQIKNNTNNCPPREICTCVPC